MTFYADTNGQQEAGYTLLELLVATAILALLSIPVAGSISLGLDSWTKSHQEAEHHERLSLVQKRIGEWLGNSYPLDVSRAALNGEARLVGTKHTLEFSAPVHPDPLQDRLSRVRLRLFEGKLQMALLPDFSYQQENVEWVWSDLITGLETFSLGYLEGYDSEGAPIWVDAWEGNAETIDLPLAVRITLSMEGEALVLVPLTVPLQIDQQAYCSYLADETCQPGANVG